LIRPKESYPLQSSYEIQNNYAFDSEQGEIRSKLTGWRMLMLSCDSWVSLEDGIYNKFPDKGSLIVMQMGFSYGSNLAEKIGTLDPKTGRTFRLDPTYLVQIMTKAGWGLISFTGDLSRGTHFSITIRNCVFCKKLHSYPCDFLRGVILGLATKMFGQEYLSSTSCGADKDGEHVCHIEITAK
jgi:hypothetical protein